MPVYTKKIAVIGGGISGIVSALIASEYAQVTLYEKDTRLGGHAHTITAPTAQGPISVDTGFMVCNPPQYPICMDLFRHLDVATTETTMSFSVSTPDTVYSSNYPSGLLADVRTLFQPRYYKMLLEIPRFHECAQTFLSTDQQDMTLEDFLNHNNFSSFVRHNHIYPMLGAIWSANSAEIARSPARAIFSFLDNHMLLQVNPGAVWRTLVGGSQTYVAAAEKRLLEHGCIIHLSSSITNILRKEGSVVVITSTSEESYDTIIFATHADTTLSLLGESATALEREILGAFSYSTNETYLHNDPSFMPRAKRAWAAWNYASSGTDADTQVSVTYNMNILQHIDPSTPLFVTLNPLTPIPQKHIYAHMTYTHPHFSVAALRAQKRLPEIQNKDRILFTGAHWGYGFHEDGARSAVNALATLNMHASWIPSS